MPYPAAKENPASTPCVKKLRGSSDGVRETAKNNVPRRRPQVEKECHSALPMRRTSRFQFNGADIVVDAGYRPAVIFLALREFFGRLRVVYGRSGGHGTCLPHSRPQQLKFKLPIASVIERLAAMSFIVLPLHPRRAAGADSRAYRKWREAALLRGR